MQAIFLITASQNDLPATLMYLLRSAHAIPAMAIVAMALYWEHMETKVATGYII
jgi:hypothetical protein